jgi:hypothetical protein
VNWQVAVALLETMELLDVVQVIASDDDGALHLGRNAHALQDFPSDAHIPAAGHLTLSAQQQKAQSFYPNWQRSKLSPNK